MQNTIPEATDIKAENAEVTQYSAVINGTRWSGIIEGSSFWPSVQEAIAEGAEVEPFVPYVPTPLDLLVKTDAELIKIAARTMEDIIQERIDSGVFVAQPVKDIIQERVALRAQL